MLTQLTYQVKLHSPSSFFIHTSIAQFCQCCYKTKHKTKRNRGCWMKCSTSKGAWSTSIRPSTARTVTRSVIVGWTESQPSDWEVFPPFDWTGGEWRVNELWIRSSFEWTGWTGEDQWIESAGLNWVNGEVFRSINHCLFERLVKEVSVKWNRRVIREYSRQKFLCCFVFISLVTN